MWFPWHDSKLVLYRFLCMSEQIHSEADFHKKSSAMLRYQQTKLLGSLLATLSLAASIFAPIILAATQANFLLLVLVFLWPICIFLMGMVRHGGAPSWFPAAALGIFFLVTPLPVWYWLIGLSTMLAYHINQNELPIQQMKLDKAFAE